MARVTRAGGVVAACVWDHGGGKGPLSPFWDAVHELDPGGPGRVRPPRHAVGPADGVLRRSRTARGRGDLAVRQRRASDVRGLVGAVHARRRACRRATSAGLESGAAGRAERALPRAVAGASVRADGDPPGRRADECELTRGGLRHVERAGAPPRRSRRPHRDSGGARRRALPHHRPRARALAVGGPTGAASARPDRPGTSLSACRSPALPSSSLRAHCFPATAATSRSVGSRSRRRRSRTLRASYSRRSARWRSARCSALRRRSSLSAPSSASWLRAARGWAKRTEGCSRPPGRSRRSRPCSAGLLLPRCCCSRLVSAWAHR